MPTKLVVCVASLLAHATAGDLVEITAKSLDSEFLSSPGGTFVKFYAPWCGHCQKLRPTWDALAESNTRAKIALIDCTKSGEICARYSVRGYPSLLFFGPGTAKTEPSEPGAEDDLDAPTPRTMWDGPIYKYGGEKGKAKRSLEELKKFADGGWKVTPQYDPSAQPPPPPPKTAWTTLKSTWRDIRESGRNLLLFLAFLATTVAFISHCCCAKKERPGTLAGGALRSDGGVPVPSPNPEVIRSFGNAPLSDQLRRRRPAEEASLLFPQSLPAGDAAGAAAAPAEPEGEKLKRRSFGNVPLSQQSPAPKPKDD